MAGKTAKKSNKSRGSDKSKKAAQSLQAPRWDLSEIYKGVDDPKIQADLDALKAAAVIFEKRHKGKIAKMNLGRILAMLGEFNVMYRKMYLLACYPDFAFTTNTKDEKTNSLVQRVELALTDVQNHFIFFSLELARHPKLAAFIEDKQAGEYRFMLQKILTGKKHQLKGDIERVLNIKSITGHSGWLKLFLKSDSAAKIKYDGKILNREQALKLLYSPSRKVRREIYSALTESFGQQNDIFAHTYNMLVLDKSQDDRMRKYETPEQARHDSNGVSQKAVDALIEATKKNFKLVGKFYGIKQKLLGLEQMQVYDRYAPVSRTAKGGRNYSFPEAAEIVRGAFADFDPQFAEIFSKLLKARHIDAHSGENKRGGAYCAEMPKGHLPYIMMNFVGSARDVQTLAHESGHAIQDVLIEKHPLTAAHPPLTVAETASVFAEMIVFENLMAKLAAGKKSAGAANSERIAMYSEKIDDVFATIFRQISFVLMEREVHALIKQKGDASAREINDIWLRVQEQMFGHSIAMPKGYEYWWGYIAHFYEYPFYVYAYAFGNLLVFVLWQEYKEAKASGDPQRIKKFVDKYKRLLAIGGTRSTMETLRRFGYDPEDPKFWQKGFDALRDLIAALAKLC